MFTPLETSLVASVVALIGICATVFIMKGNNDQRYMTRSECATERQLQCQERAALRDNLEGLKRTMRISLNMSRALVVHSDIPDEIKTAILNNEGGSK